MSYGQKKHANAILRSRYEEMMSGKAEYEKLGRTPTSSSLYGMTVNICDAWGAKIEKSGEEEQVLAQDMNASQFAAVGQEKRDLTSMINTRRKTDGTFFTGACTHY